MKRIAIINGPNLDRLGVREPDIYGNETLTDLQNRLTEEVETLGIAVLSQIMKASSLMKSIPFTPTVRHMAHHQPWRSTHTALPCATRRRRGNPRD